MVPHLNPRFFADSWLLSRCRLSRRPLSQGVVAQGAAPRCLVFCGLLTLTAACSPRVEVAVPQEPITINLNVKIQHEILVKVDREIDEMFDENSELF